MGVNIRYIVTDIESGQAGYVYNKLYCARGKMELYIYAKYIVMQSRRKIITDNQLDISLLYTTTLHNIINAEDLLAN